MSTANCAQPASKPRTYWMRHDPAFCMTGAAFSQPVRAGELRPEWFHGDCGSLDAPEYICVGGMRVEVVKAMPGSSVERYCTERADAHREVLANRAEPEPEDYFDHGWAPDEEVYTS